MSLEDLWRRQLAFTAEALPVTEGKKFDQLNEDDKINLTKTYILALHAELDEVLSNIPWKNHRYAGATNRDAILEELVDVQKYLFGLMQIWQVTPAALERAFHRKSDVVEQRFYQDHVMPLLITHDKIAIVDIDGVVADWKRGFEAWVKANEPSLSPEDYSHEVDPGLRELLKADMHSRGGMTTLPVLQNALRGVEKLIEAGYALVWLTARPVSRYPRLSADTVEWLEKNGFPTGYIYYSDLNKHLFIVEKFPLAVALFDDKPEVVARAKTFGLNAYRVENNFEECVEKFLEVQNS